MFLNAHKVLIPIVLLGGYLFSQLNPKTTIDHNDTAPKAVTPPEENRFTQTVLARDLREPMELAITRQGNVFWIERYGTIHLYDQAAKQAFSIGKLDVFAGNNDGLLGIALDPAFDANGQLYLYYSPAGATPKQHLSRFTFKNNQLDPASEKVLLEIPTQREECCHSAGSLEFGPNGDLYIAVGDNTNPSQQDGYAPVDERPDRSAFDAQRTSANTHDLRGKILRIHPQPDGTYTIPDGNLFPKDGSKGKPEIFVMGARNPFRITVDAKTSYLYFGDIGPDANKAGEKGPAAYDEINMAKKAGNYGWPYFVGDNKPYPKVDFATGAIGGYADPQAPLNQSPNNTGQRVLPPIQKPMIWYSYEETGAFPELGQGGRSAMAGEVYRFNPALSSEVKFPEYYNNSLFIYEWMRDWIKVVKLNEHGEKVSIEPFMPSAEVSSPVDMEFGQDGALYVLEYGSGWYSNNKDARLSRITYNKGNRPPVAKINASVSAGKVPLTVQFSSKGTLDHDNDQLTYQWSISATGTPKVIAKTAHPTYTFTQPGVYTCKLTVADAKGKRSEAVTEVIVGNTPPEVKIEVVGNRTFFWEKTPIPYQVQVHDREDGSLNEGSIKPDEVNVFLAYSAGGTNLSPILTAQQHEMQHPGKQLIDGSDCKSCHLPDQPSIGPSYKDVALRYQNDPGAVDRLAEKVIKGGSGVWKKEFVMVSHPQLSTKAATQMVNYILSLSGDDRKPEKIEVKGSLSLTKPEAAATSGFYQISASYQDKGGQRVKPLSKTAAVTFRTPLIQAESYDQVNRIKVFGEIEDGDNRYVGNMRPGSSALFKAIDLTDVGAITYQYATTVAGVSIEARLDSLKGPLVSLTEFTPATEAAAWQKATARVKETKGMHDLYLIARCKNRDEKDILRLDWLYFERDSGSASTR